MATPDQFPKAPPLRFELTEEQAAAIDANKPPLIEQFYAVRLNGEARAALRHARVSQARLNLSALKVLLKF
jgi:hypothetical protein